MTYNPNTFIDYFPLGLFEYSDTPIKTWNDSHRLFALNTVQQKNEIVKLANGLTVEKGNIKLAKGFSNYMITTIDPNLRKIDINFLFGKPRYPVEIYDSLSSPYYLTNLGYFYLTDNEKYDPVKPPKIRIGNLVIHSGKLMNLPILDRSAIILRKDGMIEIRFLHSKGDLEINDKIYSWRGSKSSYSAQITIYNSSNIQMDYINHPIMGPSRTAKKTFITPKVGFKLIICKRTSMGFVLARSTKLKTMINDKDMVIEVDEKLKISSNNILRVIDIDGYPVKDIFSAVSAGPIIYADSSKTAKQVDDEKFGIDMANPNNPHEPKTRIARGALVKLKDGRILSVLVDGIPQAGDICPGVTLDELAKFIYGRYDNIDSIICADPSSTMKGIYKEKGATKVFGNTHYLAHKREPNGDIKFWPNGRLGRKINSMLVVY